MRTYTGLEPERSEEARWHQQGCLLGVWLQTKAETKGETKEQGGINTRLPFVN